METTGPAWIGPARARLLEKRGPGPGWGYRVGTQPAVEATALACLALLATEGVDASARTEIGAAADWMASLQVRDGSIGVRSDLPTPTWTTPYALLTFSALTGYAEARRRAVHWLLQVKGTQIPLSPENPQNTMLQGWPWVLETHSWLEPTAWAVLALRHENLARNTRVQEGLMVIRDRAIVTQEGQGGWNYGNKSVLGTTLRPQPAPTGLALMALAGVDASSPIDRQARAYLKAALPETRAASSLGWGLLGLRAWGDRVEGADTWLVQAYDQLETTAAGGATPWRLAHLLLAGGSRTLSTFGLPEPTPPTAEPEKGR